MAIDYEATFKLWKSFFSSVVPFLVVLLAFLTALLGFASKALELWPKFDFSKKRFC